MTPAPVSPALPIDRARGAPGTRPLRAYARALRRLYPCAWSDVLRQLRQQRTTADSRPRLMERYAAFLPISAATPDLEPRRGLHAARPRAQPRPRRSVSAAPPQGRGQQPDRLVQGPRHGRGHRQGHRGRRRAVMCASTGNTSASAAAYAARAGLRSSSSFPRARSPLGKLAPGNHHGAQVSRRRQLRRRARGRARADREAPAMTLVNSVNPYRIEGQKTAAFEICEDLGGAPDYPRHPGRQRRQYHGLLEGLPRVPRPRALDDARGCSVPGRRRRAHRARPPSRPRRPSPRRSGSDRPAGPRPSRRATKSGGLIEW